MEKKKGYAEKVIEDLLKKDDSNLSKKTVEDLLKKISKKTDALAEAQLQMERRAREQAKEEGKGFIGQTIAAARAGSKAQEQFQIAKKGIKSNKRKFFKTLFGEVGDWVDVFEEKASEEEVAEAKKMFGMGDKKKTKSKKSSDVSSKKLSSILKNTTDIKKTIQKIEKVLTKTSLKAGFEFDPKIGLKGGYRNVATGKIASKEAATTTPATDRLGKLISADEDPLFQLKEQFEDFQSKTTETLELILSKLDGSIGSSGVDLDLFDRTRKDRPTNKPTTKPTTTPDPTKPTTTPDVPKKGKFGKIGQILSRAGSGIAGAASKAGSAIAGAGSAIAGAGSAAAGIASKVGAGVAGLASKATAAVPGLGTAAKVAGKLAVPVTVGMTAYDAYQAGSNAEQTLGIEGREATTGETVAAGVGGALEGITFGVVSAKTVGTGLVSAGKAVSGATSKLFNWATGKPNLDKVTTKQNSNVDTSNFEGGFEDRLAKMAAKFEEVTGNKLMITSGYRSEEKQKELWDAKKSELTKAHPEWSAAEVDRAVGKLVARPVAYGGKGSRHNSGLAVDINSKGSAGIEAINGVEIGGQKVTTDSFLAKYGLFRPMKHEPWHIQPLGDTPMPDNPDPNSKALVADASGKAMDLESGKTEAIPKAEVKAGKSAGLETPAPISGGAQIADRGGGTSTGGMQIDDRLADSGVAPAGGLGPAGQPRGPGMQIDDRLADSGITPAAGLGPAGQPRGPGMQIGDRLADSGIKPVSNALSDPGRPRGPGMKILDSGSIAPMASTTGMQVTKQSSELASNQMTASMSKPAPVVVNNVSNGGGQQPIQPPKTPLPKASAINTNTTYSRAFAHDFAHPSSFTSVGLT